MGKESSYTKPPTYKNMLPQSNEPNLGVLLEQEEEDEDYMELIDDDPKMMA